jgi:hypothetical protein
MEKPLVEFSQQTIDTALDYISSQFKLTDDEVTYLKAELGRLPLGQKFHIIGLCLRMKATLDVLGKPEISKPLITQLFNGRSEDVLDVWDRIYNRLPKEQ